MESVVTPNPNFWRGKRVLVTGHTGFKGSWLSLWLVRLGARVFGLSLPAAVGPGLFTDASLEDLVESTYADIRDASALKGAIEKIQPEIVLHLAAQSLVRPSYREPVETYATNVMGTVHTLAAATATSSVRCVIVVTSDKCYQNREWLWAYREDDPLGGYDPYSSSKACAELVAGAWRQSFCGPGTDHKIGIASVRAGNVFGGGDWAEDRLIPDCVRALAQGRPIGIRNPKATRPWQHVLNPLAGYMLLAERLWAEPDTYGEAWNFGPADEDVRPVGWIASRVVDLWGDGARWQTTSSDAHHEATLLKVDSSKARARLRWSPPLHLGTGLDWSVEWYKGYLGKQSARRLTEDQIARFEKLSSAASLL